MVDNDPDMIPSATPNLPPLDDPQTFKLRQLSLLTLASPFAPTSDTQTSTLTYPSLLQSLSLPTAASLESLVTQSIYTGLLTARLSPTSTPPVVNVTSVAPLRDLRPQSLPALLQILQTWESRCTSMIGDLEAQITAIRSTAAERSATERKRQEIVDAAVLNTKPVADPDTNRQNAGGLRTARGAHRLPSKRDIEQHMEGEDEDYSDDDARMDLDEGIGEGGVSGGAGSARGGHLGGSGGAGGSRGAKRNRGRGSK